MVCDRLCCKRATSTAFEAALRIRTLLDFARSNRPESLSRRCWNLSAVGGCGHSLTETPYLRSLKAGRQDYRTSTTRGNCSLRMPRHRTNMRPSTLPPKSCARRIQSRSDWASDRSALFQSRFRRSLEIHSFGKKLSLALSKAMQEMADNVVQHSGPDEEHPALGLVGYHVGKNWMTYAVADIGRGVLASLQTNPTWASLPGSGEALRESVCHYASRRADAPHGTGFSEVQKSLADLNGTLRFRSGNACLSLVGRQDARRATISSNPYLVGFQLAVTCSLAVDNRIRSLAEKD